MKKDKNDPCWSGYKQLGTKKKNGKTVPNCVPMKEESGEKTKMKPTNLKSFKEKLAEAIDPVIGGITEDEMNPSDLAYLSKFCSQISGAYQSTMPNLLNRIETELNKFAYTLGELDMDIPFEEEGSEDFAILKSADGTFVKNAFLTLEWTTVSGQQYALRPDGSKLRLDVTLTLNIPDPDEDLFQSDVDEYMSEETEKDYDSSNAGKKADLTIERVAISTQIGKLRQELITAGVLPKNGGIKPDASPEVLNNPKVKKILALKKQHDALGEKMQALKEAVDNMFKMSLKDLSDSQLKQKLRYFREKDQDKYNAIVSEFESRGLKEDVLEEAFTKGLHKIKTSHGTEKRYTVHEVDQHKVRYTDHQTGKEHYEGHHRLHAKLNQHHVPKKTNEEVEALDESTLLKKTVGKTLSLKTKEGSLTTVIHSDGSLQLTVEDRDSGETASLSIQKAKAEEFLTSVMDHYISKTV